LLLCKAMMGARGLPCRCRLVSAARQLRCHACRSTPQQSHTTNSPRDRKGDVCLPPPWDYPTAHVNTCCLHFPSHNIHSCSTANVQTAAACAHLCCCARAMALSNSRNWRSVWLRASSGRPINAHSHFSSSPRRLHTDRSAQWVHDATAQLICCCLCAL
jgi:hypothetical protein